MNATPGSDHEAPAYWRPHATLHVAHGALMAGILVLVGCGGGALPGAAPGAQPSAGPSGAARPGQEALIPAGYGTLREAEITIAFSLGDVRVRVTPLAESVIRTTAPDTYRRLSRLAASHRAAAARRGGVERPRLFLVSLFSDVPDVAFEPRDLEIVSQGLRHRPLAVLPVTPGWEQRRLRQRVTEMAVYAYDDGVDLEQDMEVEFGTARSDAWQAILPKVRAERARARARAGPPRPPTSPRHHPYSSSPNFLILR